jgi:two-component system nitrogen regulation response regulator NtrX
MMPSILIVDDEHSILQSLSGLLSDEGFEVATAANGYEALKAVHAESPDLVLLDIWMPGIDGLETLKQIKDANAYLPVIIITGHGTIETAVKATKLGAFDFIEKPLSFEKVIVAINNALNFRRLEEENRYLRKKTIEKHSLTGASPATIALKKQIGLVAPNDAWILICGENGTGKELVARTIHHLSPRAEHPMIDVDCASIPEDHIESELFGHEKGALEGIADKKRGKFELVGKGTLFLDEIGDMSLKMQSKILRVLQELKFQRLGGTRSLSFGARVIAATNKSLEKQIEAGLFREDLYYRLNVIPIEIEPLRNRKEDIPALIDIFLEEAARQNREKRKTITPDAVALLNNYAWPGNVRELKNLVERLAIMVEKPVIDATDIPAFYTGLGPSVGRPMGSGADLLRGNSLKEAREAFERLFIRYKLSLFHNDPVQTAAAIGVSQGYLRRQLSKDI